MKLTITGYSTALFSTWYFVEEYRLLFDAGDGVAATLLQKSRKIDHIFLSHADRDHLTGLVRLNELIVRDGLPRLYFPADAGSFSALEIFSKQFDARVGQTHWQGVANQESVMIQKDVYVQALRNNHVVSAQPHQVKSVSYQLYQLKPKLKTALVDVPQDQLTQMALAYGREAMTEPVRSNLVGYSGDTPADQLAQWNHTPILIHEATFLRRQDIKEPDPNRNRHSTLEEVLREVAQLTIETLILGHFSSRYSPDEIDLAIKKYCQLYKIQIPVYRLLPGQVQWDILQSQPIN
ncbi:ribonuclease Z [Spirosoma horti]